MDYKFFFFSYFKLISDKQIEASLFKPPSFQMFQEDVHVDKMLGLSGKTQK